MKAFGRVVVRVMESLPDSIKPYLENVVVDVEDEPDEEIEAGGGAYGLFEPIGLPSDASGDAIDLTSMPYRIVIYKRPLEEDFPERRELMTEIRRTVIHEIAHHFGITDRDIDRDPSLEDGPWRRED